MTTFVGRDDELNQLHEQLQAGRTIALSAISGMGGIGKTELALQYAYQHLSLQTYPGGVCWLKAREDLNSQIVLFARSHLGLAIPEDLELVAQVAYCWRNWRPGRTLIVFDDVQTYQDVVSVSIPQRSQFRVLLTTRLTLQSPVQNLAIKVLSEAKALELLGAIVERDRPDLQGFGNLGGLETAKQLCHWLGYLPLGIELVGRYLVRKPDTSLSTLWQRLQDKKLEAKALKDAAPEMTAELGVAAAFELSWQELGESAQTLAALLSLFALAEIPWTLVEACLPDEDPEDLEDRRDESLLNLHLLERTGEGIYQLHQLLREFFAAKREQMAEEEEMKRSFCQVMVAVAQQISYPVTLTIIEQTSPAISHLKEAATTLTLWFSDQDLTWTPTSIARFYEGQSAFGEAEEWQKHCLATAIQRLGADHPDVATTLNNLASLYRTQGRYTEAEPLFQRALAIGEQQLGANHLDVAMSLNNLAGLYQDQERYAEAESLFQRALTIGEQQLGADHPHVATMLNNLALLYQDQGRYTKAERLRLRCLEIEKQTLEENHPQFAASLNNLALLYRYQERYTEAEPLFQCTLTIGEQQLGANHPDVAIRLNNLATLYHDQRRYSEAEPLFLRALAILVEKLGKDHPNTQMGWQNFWGFLQQVIEAGQTGQLSDHPVTQDLLRQMREDEGMRDEG